MWSFDEEQQNWKSNYTTDSVDDNDVDDNGHHLDPHLDLCDESKCVSTGGSDGLFGDSFTCYGDEDGTLHPRLCADGYVPRWVDYHRGASQYYNESSDESVELSYFTCCPPSTGEFDSVTRSCSDPVVTAIATTKVHESIEWDEDAKSNNLLCSADSSRPYYRQMKPRRFLDRSTSDDDDDDDDDDDENENEEMVVESHLCCDSLIDPTRPEELTGANTSSRSYLEETECVPYHNDMYKYFKPRNKLGLLAAITCNFPTSDHNKSDGRFVVPQMLVSPEQIADGSALSSYPGYYMYQCCKSGPSAPLVIRDTNFKFTIYPQIVASSLALIFAFVIIFGLSIPPLLQLIRNRRNKNSRSQEVSSSRTFKRLSKRKLYQRNGASTSGFSRPEDSSNKEVAATDNSTRTIAAKERESEMFDTFIHSIRRRRSSVLRNSKYNKSIRRYKRALNKLSTFNLYLVYLAIPDLLMNLSLLGLYGSYAVGYYHPGLCTFVVGDGGVGGETSDYGCVVGGKYFDGALFKSVLYTYYTTNIYLNCVVAYEVYTLLQDSKNFQKRRPPSTRAVTLRCMTVYAISIVFGACYHGSGIVFARASSAELARTFRIIQVGVFNGLLLTLCPLVFLSTICLLIWKRGLMPSAATDTGASTKISRSQTSRSSIILQNINPTTAIETRFDGGSLRRLSSSFSFVKRDSIKRDSSFRLSAKNRVLRELAWYFFRIVAVFYACWFPLGFLKAFDLTSASTISYLVIASQQILSTSLALTKSDVRKRVVDFCTLSFLRDGATGGTETGVPLIGGRPYSITDSGSSGNSENRLLIITRNNNNSSSSSSHYINNFNSLLGESDPESLAEEPTPSPEVKALERTEAKNREYEDSNDQDDDEADEFDRVDEDQIDDHSVEEVEIEEEIDVLPVEIHHPEIDRETDAVVLASRRSLR